MTRETKAGLVVSCSFLCLVGVVLYSKLTGPKPPLGGEYAAGTIEAPAAPTRIDNNKLPEAMLPVSSDNPLPSPDKVATTTGSGDLKTPVLDNTGQTSSQTKTDGPLVIDPTDKTSVASKPEKSSKEENSASASSTYAIPDPVDDNNSSSKNLGVDNPITKTGATLDPIQDAKETNNGAQVKAEKDPQDTSKTSWPLPSEEPAKEKNSEVAKNGPKSDAPNKVATDSGNSKDLLDTGSLGTDTKLKNTKGTPDQEPPPIPKGVHDPFQSLPETPATAAGSPATASPRDASIRKTTVNPSGANRGKASGRAITGVVVAPAQAEKSSTVPTTLTPNLVQAADLSSPTNVNSANQLATNSVQGHGLTPGVMPSPRTLAMPPAGDTAPEPNVRLGPPTGNLSSNSNGQEKSASTTNPGFGLPPSDQVAQGPAPNLSGPGSSGTYQTPSFAPAPPNVPVRTPAQVDSYDEETYLCKQGDSFVAISMKFFQSEKYSQALLLFNRNHPRATAGVRQDPPSLTAGQPVYIPPLRVLEKRYPTAISDHVSMEQSATPNPTNPEAGSYSLPSAPKEVPGAPEPANYSLPDTRNPVSPLPTPGLNPAKPSMPTGPTYIVPKNGQTLWEISRQTLGNPNRWSEILRLNEKDKKLDPSHPIPEGTTLRMPADARLEAPAPMVDKVN